MKIKRLSSTIDVIIMAVTSGQTFSIRPAHWTLRPQDFETCCPYASDCLLAYGCPYASHCLSFMFSFYGFDLALYRVAVWQRCIFLSLNQYTHRRQKYATSTCIFYNQNAICVHRKQLDSMRQWPSKKNNIWNVKFIESLSGRVMRSDNETNKTEQALV